LGERQPPRLGVGALVDFSLSVTAGGEALTNDEIQALLAAESGLVSVRGQWMEVDRESLGESLGYWRKIEKTAKKAGVPFAEAMRLLSGVTFGGGRSDSPPHGTARGLLCGRIVVRRDARRLRDPELASGPLPWRPTCTRRFGLIRRPRAWLHFLACLELGGCLADDMGLGKTIQTLALLLWLKREATGHAPSLLVAPASLLANWRGEARRFAPSLRLLVVHPSGNADPLLLKQCEESPENALARFDLVVTTYGMVRTHEWLEDVVWRLVVLDEAQAVKNAGTQQARAVKRLRAVSRLALTGTPVENRAGDLWSLFDFINPGLLGGAKSFETFLRAREDMPDAYAPVRVLTRPYILRRLKTDRRVIADLPEKTLMPAYCGLTPAQAALYARQVQRLKGELEEGAAAGDPMTRRARILTALTRFKQICNHPAQALGDGDFAESRSGKFARLRALCEEIAERQEKVLVFTQYREMTEPLAAFLATVFRRPGLVLHGGTPVELRASAWKRSSATTVRPFSCCRSRRAARA
jgi:non-specific serine/threonine protein kinase